MSKFFRIGLLTMLMLVLVAGTALAGTLEFRPGVNAVNVSSQALGTATNLLINAAGSVVIRYTSGQDLTSSNFINISFDEGVKFAPGTTVNICGNGAASYSRLGQASAGSSGSNNLMVQLNTNATGSIVYITTNECSTSATGTVTSLCQAGNHCAANIQIAAGASGMKKIYVKLTSSGGQVFDSGSNNIVNIASEFTPSLTAADTITIDYQGTGSDGKVFTGNTKIAGSANKLEIAHTTKEFGANAGQNSGGYYISPTNQGLTGNVLMYFKDSQEWQGVTKIYAANDIACPASTDSKAVGVINAPSSGTATVNASDAFKNADPSKISACFEVNGNEVLQPRIIKGAFKIAWGSKGVDIDKSNNFENIQIWDVNAYQGLISWLVKSDALKTYCLVHNNGTQTANVNLQTFSTEQANQISSLSLGTLAAKTSQLYVFGDQVVAGSSTYDLTGLQSPERYSAIITVTSPQDQVVVSCNQFDPNGAKRLVPVLTGQTTGPKWKN